MVEITKLIRFGKCKTEIYSMLEDEQLQAHLTLTEATVHKRP